MKISLEYMDFEEILYLDHIIFWLINGMACTDKSVLKIASE